MKLICPSCGAVCGADAWSNDPLARQCLAIVAELPADVSRRCLSYLALFRPHGGRGLQWAKTLRLLSELKGLIDAPHVSWDAKPDRPNSAKAWGDALEQIVCNPPRRLPLKSHGYLRSIVYDLTDEMDRKTEVRRNQLERTGSVERREDQQWQPSREDFAKVRASIRGIGKKI